MFFFFLHSTALFDKKVFSHNFKVNIKNDPSFYIGVRKDITLYIKGQLKNTHLIWMSVKKCPHWWLMCGYLTLMVCGRGASLH